MLKHMEIAQTQLGQTEIAGDAHNPAIIEYFKATTYHATEDEVPWCAAFVNWVLMKSEIARTKSAAALSFLDWGVPVKLKDVRYGDVAVMDRGGGRGHVGFVIGFNDKKEVGLLGGNQGDQVNVCWFPVEDIREFRRTKTLLKSKTVAAAGATAATSAGAAALVAQSAQKVNEAATKATNEITQAVDGVSSVTDAATQVLVQTNEIQAVVGFLPENWKLPAIYIFGLINLGFIIYERWKRLKEHNV